MSAPLPLGWATASLSDVVDIWDYARVPVNKGERARRAGPYPYYGANGQVGTIDGYLFDGDHVLIAEDGGYFDDKSKRVAYAASGKFWVNNHAHVVSPRRGLSRDYLVYALHTVDWMQFVRGSTRLKLTQAAMRDVTIPLAPAREQDQVVAKIDALLSMLEVCRHELERVGRLIEAHRRAVLSKALPAEAHAAGHPRVRLIDVVEGLTYGSSAKSAKKGTVPVLRMGNIQDGELDWTDLAYTSDQREIEKYQLCAGDVLFNRTNSAELVGKTALFSGERSAIFAGYLIRVRCGPLLRPAYLTHLLNSPAGREYCSAVKSDGINQSNISATKLGQFEFELPSLEEQDEAVRVIEKARAWGQAIQRQVNQAEKLLAGLELGVFSSAFAGELTERDLSEGDAEELLRDMRELDRENATVAIPQLDDKSVRKGRSSVSKRRTDVSSDHLRSVIAQLGGAAETHSVWASSGMLIDEFYKQLRSEMQGGGIQQDSDKARLRVRDAS